MHHFQYTDDRLFAENVPVSQIADAVGTPFYLYSHATLMRHYRVFDQALEGIERMICFSAKANSSQAILKLFASQGSGLDIVSGGELHRGLAAGFDPQRIVYSGVGKRADEIDYALDADILMFNVESLQELALIDERAGRMGKKARVAIRVNPDVDAQTHPYISTGLKKNKFGIDVPHALQGYRTAANMANIHVRGIDCHIGSQITQAQPFADALANLIELVQTLARERIRIQWLDMGGGLGITYHDEKPPQPADYAHTLVNALKPTGLKLIVEPGRVIVGNAGILVTRVLYSKATAVKHFTVVDAGMNDLMRPALYGAFHQIQPVIRQPDRPTVQTDIVGPICESSDFLAQDRDMSEPRPGDLLAIMSAGAYGFAMASNYCSRLHPAEVMVSGDQFSVIRKRQQYADLTAGETVPTFINGE